MTIKKVSEKYGISQDALRYYERSGMVPPVSRTAGGTRDYSEEDLRWVELALCMRSAGQGDGTIPERLALLQRQREALREQQRQIDTTLQRLNYKISRYEDAIKTGTLTW